MKIDKFLNQTAQYQQRVGTDDYGEDLYAEARPIKARIERTSKMIQTPDGSIHAARTTYYLNQQVNVGDKLDGEYVIDVFNYVWRDGSTQGWEATT